MLRCLAPLVLLTASCSTTPSGAPLGLMTTEINSTHAPTSEHIAPGDVLSVQFVHVDQPWDQELVTVHETGMASFVGLDTIQVAGKTVEDLDKELTELYTPLVTPADLAVSVVTSAPPAVFLFGEFATPGRYEYGDGVTLLEAFTLAGGPIRDTARLDQILLIRWDPVERRQLHWKIDAGVDQWTTEEPLRLQDRDVVFIPATAATKVNDWVDRYLRRNIPLPSLFGPAY